MTFEQQLIAQMNQASIDMQFPDSLQRGQGQLSMCAATRTMQQWRLAQAIERDRHAIHPFACEIKQFPPTPPDSRTGFTLSSPCSDYRGPGGF